MVTEDSALRSGEVTGNEKRGAGISEYVPPFQMTDNIMNLLAETSEQIGRIKFLSHGNLNSHLRKENRIRTIHSSLAIEQNSLTLEQVTAIFDGKRILGNPMKSGK